MIIQKRQQLFVTRCFIYSIEFPCFDNYFSLYQVCLHYTHVCGGQSPGCQTALEWPPIVSTQMFPETSIIRDIYLWSFLRARWGYVIVMVTKACQCWKGTCLPLCFYTHFSLNERPLSIEGWLAGQWSLSHGCPCLSRGRTNDTTPSSSFWYLGTRWIF